MKIIITGRKLDITEGLKEYITKKMNKLAKFFDDDTDCNVTLSTAKGDRHILEVTIYYKGLIYRAEEVNRDMYAGIDKSIDVLDRQIRKNKTKLAKRLRENVNFAAPDAEPVEEELNFEVVRKKRYGVKPMSVEEAILQMNLLGHQFYIFKNAETEETNIVYTRKEGGYGLIEAE